MALMHEGTLVEQRLAKAIQATLHKHQVRPDTISETIAFLGTVLGGIISIYAPSMSSEEVLNNLKDDVEYGMETGIPEA